MYRALFYALDFYLQYDTAKEILLRTFPLPLQHRGLCYGVFGTDETTVYLTDSTVITKGRSGQEGSASDLAVGSIVRMVLEDAQIIRVDIME